MFLRYSLYGMLGPLESRHLFSFMPAFRFLDLGQTICVAYATYTTTVTFFGLPKVGDESVRIPTWPLVFLFSCFTEFIVRVSYYSSTITNNYETPYQIIFIRRIQKFAGNQELPVICYLLTGVTFCCGVWISIEVFRAQSFSGLMQTWSWLVISTLVGIVVADSLIAATLTYHLKHSQKSLERWGTRTTWSIHLAG